MKPLLLRVLLVGALAPLVAFTGGERGANEPPGPQDQMPEGISCGLGKEFHSGRRAALLESIDEGIILLRGLPETRSYTLFHQDTTFWYLTGGESPDTALILDKASGREILFLPEIHPWREQWEGERWTSAIGG